jgi:hypothetical protein
LLTAYGARVDMVTEPHPVGGWQQARKDRVAELLAADPQAWNPNQYGNPDNVDAYGRWRWSWSRSWDASMSWCARWEPVDIQRAWPGSCASSTRRCG